jgi:hypothetical protein
MTGKIVFASVSRVTEGRFFPAHGEIRCPALADRIRFLANELVGLTLADALGAEVQFTAGNGNGGCVEAVAVRKIKSAKSRTRN